MSQVRNQRLTPTCYAFVINSGISLSVTAKYWAGQVKDYVSFNQPFDFSEHKFHIPLLISLGFNIIHSLLVLGDPYLYMRVGNLAQAVLLLISGYEAIKSSLFIGICGMVLAVLCFVSDLSEGRERTRLLRTSTNVIKSHPGILGAQLVNTLISSVLYVLYVIPLLDWRESNETLFFYSLLSLLWMMSTLSYSVKLITARVAANSGASFSSAVWSVFGSFMDVSITAGAIWAIVAAAEILMNVRSEDKRKKEDKEDSLGMKILRFVIQQLKRAVEKISEPAIIYAGICGVSFSEGVRLFLSERLSERWARRANVSSIAWATFFMYGCLTVSAAILTQVLTKNAMLTTHTVLFMIQWYLIYTEPLRTIIQTRSICQMMEKY